MLANTEREDKVEHILETQGEELNKKIYSWELLNSAVLKPLSKCFLTWYIANFSSGFTHYRINPPAII